MDEPASYSTTDEATAVGQPYSPEAVAEIYSRILRVCVAAGVGLPESEDLAQDVWEWLLRMGCPVLALTAPWLAAVVHNHVLRYRRRIGRQQTREGTCLDAIREPKVLSDTSTLESNEVLDRVACFLPPIERKLLALVRKGYSLAKAAEFLGIPRGSRAYYGDRLVRLARAGIRARFGNSKDAGNARRITNASLCGAPRRRT